MGYVKTAEEVIMDVSACALFFLSVAKSSLLRGGGTKSDLLSYILRYSPARTRHKQGSAGHSGLQVNKGVVGAVPREIPTSQLAQLNAYIVR